MIRRWMAVPLIWLPVGAAVATWAAWSDRLPDRIATHWGGSGPADRFSSTTGFWTVLLIIMVAAGLGGIVAAVLARRSGWFHFLLPAAGAVTGGVTGLWAATALATLDNPDDPRLGWRILLFFAGLAWGIAVRLVTGPAPVPPGAVPAGAVPGGAVPSGAVPGGAVRGGTDAFGLKPTERAAFRTTLTSPMLTGATLGSAAIVVLLAATVQPGLWPVALVPALAGLLFGRITITADHRGVRLVAGLIGIPVKQIPLADITAATAEDINPVEWGGWGYRVTPGRSALVLRGGPGLVLHLRDGRRFAVTMNQPEIPATLLTALRARVPS